MSSDKKMLEALDKIEDIIGTQEGGIGTQEGDIGTHMKVRTHMLPPSVSMCSKYEAIKKLLGIALPYIAKIPLYGPKIVIILQFLMTIADNLCPASDIK